MNETAIRVIGLLAEAVLIVSQLPQIYKSFKTKSTEDLSLLTILAVITGLILWIIYGILKPDGVIVIANIGSLITFGLVFYAKIKYS